MQRDLKFLKTWTVPEFKAQQHVETLDIMYNEATGKCFFVYGVDSGACSKKARQGELTNPVVSEVCSAETGDTFMLLHQKGEYRATQLARL